MTSIIVQDFLDFFTELAANQSRDWFLANKARYEVAVKLPMRDLVIATNAALAAHAVPLSGDPKRSVSRINRDVRFSADKSPYKIYSAATFTRVPGEMSPGLLYLHLAPGECFAGLGFYAVDPADLTQLRAAIVAAPDDWSAVVEALTAAGHPLEEGDPLKRMPKGFEAYTDAPFATDVKRRSLVAKRWMTPEEVADGLPERLASFAELSKPLIEFGWRAVDVSPRLPPLMTGVGQDGCARAGCARQVRRPRRV